MKMGKLFLAAAAVLFALPLSASAGTLSLSQTYVSLAVGQTATVAVLTTNGEIANIVYNSGSNVVSAVASGNDLTLLGMSAGSSEVRLCTSDNDCGTVYVSVGGSGNHNSGITFSNSSVSINAGQSTTVTIYSGYSGNYYVSNNSNSSVASASISGSTLTIYGNMAGTASITVCGSYSSGQCSTVTATVSGSSSGSSITFSPSSLTLNAGSSQSATIYHSHYYGNSGDNFYLSGNTNTSVASATVSGTRLDVYGLQNGYTSFTVCNYNYSGCGTLSVTVSGSGNGSIWASPSSVSLSYRGNTTVNIYSGNSNYSNGYYISNNSNSSAVTASVSGNTVYLYGNNNGSSTITICSNYGAGCVSVPVTVGDYGGYLAFSSTSLPQPVMSQYYSQQLSATGGSWPYVYTLISGSLPGGLVLGHQGLISGTPTAAGTSTFLVRVTDNNGRTASQWFTMTIGSVSGVNTFRNGTLIRENGTIYTVYKTLKSGFANMEAFNGLGYKLTNVIDSGSTSLANSGYVIGTAGTAHPWGTWIKQNNTVYFIHESGLIPVAYYDVFLNNGGEDRMVVPANHLDFFGKQILSLMSHNDWRLR